MLDFLASHSLLLWQPSFSFGARREHFAQNARLGSSNSSQTFLITPLWLLFFPLSEVLAISFIQFYTKTIPSLLIRFYLQVLSLATLYYKPFTIESTFDTQFFSKTSWYYAAKSITIVMDSCLSLFRFIATYLFFLASLSWHTRLLPEIIFCRWKDTYNTFLQNYSLISIIWDSKNIHSIMVHRNMDSWTLVFYIYSYQLLSQCLFE